MNYEDIIAKQLNIRPQQVVATIELLDSGNTVPFISRYRKEVTGGLDEEQIRQVNEIHDKLKSLDERRETILKSIEEQGKMTDELRQQIMDADTMTALEDLYLPYKPKRKTRASVARERGLQPLADLILQQSLDIIDFEEQAQVYLSEDLTEIEDVWAGARDIVAETISDHAEVRKKTRDNALKRGTVKTDRIEKGEDPKGVFQLYYEFEGRVDRLRPHQVLALNRGESEKVLRVSFDIPEHDWRSAISAIFPTKSASPLIEQLKKAVDDAAARLLLPAIERDVRRELSEKAENHAIRVFASNLRALLCQAPLLGYSVLGIDPGFRTGSKIAVVDATGKLLDTATIYPHEPQKKKEAALQILEKLVIQHEVSLITIGNGTASRETEQLVAELIGRFEETGKNRHIVKYLIVNEAGASVYSASPLARAEFPELDVSIRGAVSIARRAQDPLAELVKIDPKSIGVGMYQHDVDQKKLTEALDDIVESVVNQVGVDVNTASPSLLMHVAGIGPKLAERIVAHRNDNGPFINRESLSEVSGFGPKVYEQAAGFLRIRDGNNPLDSSAIHPESYGVAEAVLEQAGIDASSQPEMRKLALEQLKKHVKINQLAQNLSTGVPTLVDIFDQLVRPGRDPREDTPPPILRSDVLKMEDLTVGMVLKGTVRNVVDFGAFIDIGVKQDGLLHRTKIPQNKVIHTGDIIEVAVQKIEVERGRISLEWPDSKIHSN